MSKEVLNKLLEQFKGKQMTINVLSEKLNMIFPDKVLEFNGHVYKCEDYLIQVEYLDKPENFDDSKIKILNILDVYNLK